MAKIQPAKKKLRKKVGVPEAELPQRKNYLIILAGIATVVVGYIVMAMGDDVSPLSVTVAPLILFLGYCVVIPVGILYRKRAESAAKGA